MLSAQLLRNGLLLAVLLAAQPAYAQESIELRLRVHEQQARLEVARWEAQSQTATGPPADQTRSLPASVRTVVASSLQKTYTAATSVNTSQADPTETAIRQAWRQAITQRAAFDADASAREREYGFDWTNRSRPPLHLTWLDTALLIWAGFAFAMSVSLAVRELRVGLRQHRRARMSGGVALLLVASLLAFETGCDSSDPTTPENTKKSSLEDELQQATAEADRLTSEADRQHVQLIDRWAKFLDPDDAPSSPAKLLKENEPKVLQIVRGAAVQAVLTARLAEEAERELAQLEKDTAKLDELVAGSRWRAVAFAVVRVVAAVLLALAVLVPYRLARRRVAAQRLKDSQTCARCLAEGMLSVQKVARGTHGYDEAAYLECRACGYRCRKSHQDVPRLCFPTVGIRAGGKTHMLTTAYARVQNRMAPTTAAVQTAPSIMDERFRQYVELVLRHRGQTGATLHDTQFLDPLLLHVRDTDRWGANNVLVNLFDYSGELIEETPLAQQLRPRAMKMDGFMMFFDPTQLYGDNANAYLEDQVQALNNFHQQMLDVRKLAPGTVVPSPVAVCISKFDLLESSNPIGGQCLPFIERLVGPLNPPGPVSLKVLKARSDLVEQMLPLMFPGVDIRRMIRDYFGNQLLFFPMSSVNLNIDEFGQIDVRARNPNPYGVVEPILWLLHMHGYCVFD